MQRNSFASQTYQELVKWTFKFQEKYGKGVKGILLCRVNMVYFEYERISLKVLIIIPTYIILILLFLYFSENIIRLDISCDSSSSR